MRRTAFTLYELLAAMSAAALLLGLAPPAVLKIRERAQRSTSQNNLKQLAFAAQAFYDEIGLLPSGNDENNFSAAVYLLPYIEQGDLYTLIDVKQSIDAKENTAARRIIVKTFLSPLDPVRSVSADYGATNYLFNAGSQYSLTDNDGIFYQGSKTQLTDITDGLSNTLMIGETLKGDGGVRTMDVNRQHVALKKAALAGLTADSGVQDFKDDKNLAADRCASWMDGRFLQGTFNSARMANDPRPDVTCEGFGGLSGLRTTNNLVNVAMCDGSVRAINVAISAKVWKALATRNGGEVIPEF